LSPRVRGEILHCHVASAEKNESGDEGNYLEDFYEDKREMLSEKEKSEKEITSSSISLPRARSSLDGNSFGKEQHLPADKVSIKAPNASNLDRPRRLDDLASRIRGRRVS